MHGHFTGADCAWINLLEQGRHAERRPGAVLWLPRSIGRAGSAAAVRIGQLIKQCSSLGARGEEK